MDSTAIYLCENIQNVKLGYVQSDEITLLLCDFENYDTSQFFNGNIQKMSSVIASLATAKFNQYRIVRQLQHVFTTNTNMRVSDLSLAAFDCRVWNVPSQWEAANTFIWRNQDCSRNSLSMVAQANFSHKELQNKSQLAMHEMLHAKGINWTTDYTAGEKNGRLIVKETYLETAISPTTCVDFERTHWVSKGAWKFTENKEKLLNMIPKYDTSGHITKINE